MKYSKVKGHHAGYFLLKDLEKNHTHTHTHTHINVNIWGNLGEGIQKSFVLFF